jgi:hypothetical protein
MRQSDSNGSSQNITLRFHNIFQNRSIYKNQINDFINDADLKQMAGCVIRGSQEAHFKYLYLQKDVSAKTFAWLMGDDGLMLFLEQSNLEALHSIGCDDR